MMPGAYYSFLLQEQFSHERLVYFAPASCNIFMISL